MFAPVTTESPAAAEGYSDATRPRRRGEVGGEKDPVYFTEAEILKSSR
jgi:hypothetical protein